MTTLTHSKALPRISARREKVKGVASVDNGIGAVSPEIKVTVDKSKAAEKGLTVAQVYQQVAAAISTEKTLPLLRMMTAMI